MAWTRKINTFEDDDLVVVTTGVNELLLSLSNMNNAVPPGSTLPIVFDTPAVTLTNDGVNYCAMVSYTQQNPTP